MLNILRAWEKHKQQLSGLVINDCFQIPKPFKDNDGDKTSLMGAFFTYLIRK